MKSLKNKYILALILSVVSIYTATAQTITRSYFCLEMGTRGQVPRVPDRQATFVQWYDNGSIKMLDGTIWKFRNQSFDGIRHYAFAGSSGPVMPGTQYMEAMFSNDFTVMQINYAFGIMGMMVPMYSIYKFIGEGTQPAYDWISGNY